MSTDDRSRGPGPPGTATPPDLETHPTQLTPQSIPRFAVGTVVAGRYQIVEELGVGGMGIVYRARDHVLELDVALKALRPEVAHDADFLQRFRNELIIARQVTHRNVVRIHDLGDHDGVYFMTMDLVEGRSLRDVLKHEAPLPVQRAVQLCRQIAQALAEAHRQGVVHRDLKPENILLDGRGDAYVTDFGVARSVHAPGMTRTGVVLGTPDYLSPEQAKGEKVDGRSDLFTLGLMLVEMLSGKMPFAGGSLFEILAQRISGKPRSLRELGVEVPASIEAIIDRCLANDIEERYQSAEEIVADLDDLDRPVRRRAGRRARGWGWAVVAALVLALGALTALYLKTLSQIGDIEMPPWPEEPAVPTARHAVAVLPFEVDASLPELGWVSGGSADRVARALGDDSGLRVVDAIRVLRRFEALGLDAASLRADQIDDLADTFQVDRIVRGAVRSAGGEVVVEARIVNPASLDSPSTAVTERGSAAELPALLYRLAAALTSALGGDPDSTRASDPIDNDALASYSRGVGLLAKGTVAEAVSELVEATETQPRFAEAWLRLSRAYRDMGRLEEAADASRRSVAAVDGSLGRIALETRAEAALLAGNPQEAQEILEELVELYPFDSSSQLALAEAYGEQGRFEGAVERLRKAVQVDASDPRAWYLLGRFSIVAGEIRPAVNDHLVRALVLEKKLRNPQGQGDVYNALGVGYQRLGLHDQAEENYTLAAEIRERIGDLRGVASSLSNLVLVSLARGDYEAAEASIERGLGIHEELGNPAGIAEFYNMRGILEEERGDYAEALRWYRDALREREGLGDEWVLAESHNNVGYAYYLLGEYDNAKLYFDRALELYRKNEDLNGVATALQSLGICQVALGEWSEAETSFQESLSLAREMSLKLAIAVSLGNLGLVSQHQGRYGVAFERYEEARGILADLGEARGEAEFAIHQAAALLELGRFDAAEERLEEAQVLQEEGGNREQEAVWLIEHAYLHLGRGESGEAARHFAEAREVAETSKSAAAELGAGLGHGIAMLAGGREDEAEQQLELVLGRAESLQHAVLRLRAGEALAAAQLRVGDTRGAKATLRAAFRLLDRVEAGTYARSYRLHELLSAAHAIDGESSLAEEQASQAAKEVARIREGLAGQEELLRSFDALPSASEIWGVRDTPEPAAAGS